MRRTLLASIGPAVAVLALVPATAMAQSGAEDGWTTPRTPWGEPDLQGVWTSATLTLLERPGRQSDKAELTAEEAATRDE